MISMTGTLSKGFMAKELGVKFNREYYFDLKTRHEVDCKCNKHVAEMFPGLELFYSEANLGRRRYYNMEQVLVGGIQPNMILGMLLGAEFVPNESMDADITPGIMAGKSADDLPDPRSLLDHKLIKFFTGQLRVVRAEGALAPIPPFFWDSSGRAAVHGPMTSAQKYFGEEFLMDMMTEPERCLKIMNWIADAFIVLVRHFSEAGHIPVAGIHIGECSSCMISPDLFRQFVAPAVSKFGRVFNKVRLHSCGDSSHIIRWCGNITGLQSLDVGAGTSVAKVREVFGKKLPLSIAPAAGDLSGDDPGPVLEWAQRVIAENDGGKLTFVFHLEPDYNLDIISALDQLVKSRN